MVRPYIEEGNIRTFPSETDESTLVWHRDKETRLVTVIEGSGWKFQFDNALPFDIFPGKKFSIEKMVYHRLLKGSTSLTLKIEKQ